MGRGRHGPLFRSGLDGAVGWPPGRADDAAAVDATYGELVDAGYDGHREPWDAFWGQRYAIVLDPDGNSVDLFAAL